MTQEEFENPASRQLGRLTMPILVGEWTSSRTFWVEKQNSSGSRASQHCQLELAERIGEHQTFVSKCERGIRRVDIVELKRWTDALGIVWSVSRRSLTSAWSALGL